MVDGPVSYPDNHDHSFDKHGAKWIEDNNHDYDDYEDWDPIDIERRCGHTDRWQFINPKHLEHEQKLLCHRCEKDRLDEIDYEYEQQREHMRNRNFDDE